MNSLTPTAKKKSRREILRPWFQTGFFVLFVMTPLFDLLRYDLTQGHAYLLTFEWRLGLGDFLAGKASAGEAATLVLLRFFVPVLLAASIFIAVAWRWGRLYCGWLCPHFSVVETLNRLMIFTLGKHSLWDKRRLPNARPHPAGWLLFLPLAIGFAFVWAVVLLTYLLPPLTVYHHLWNQTLTRNEGIFIAAATSVITLEFLFARHLFCRYACAVGLFQSLAWMSNKEALVVGFARPRLVECADCLHGAGSACDAACPMRLKPRTVKRWMFTCTQCTQCISACEKVNQAKPEGALLHWVQGPAARANEAGFSANDQLSRKRET